MFGLVLAVVVLGERRTSRISLLEASKEVPKGRRAVVHVVDRRHVDDGEYRRESRQALTGSSVEDTR
jgi:hypothetical protein